MNPRPQRPPRPKSPEQLMRKRRPPRRAITARSTALFRLGEICNNHCEMCSNSGDPTLWKIETEELLRRVDFLAESGIRRVVVTGGEPTVHPGFWEVVSALQKQKIHWDINSNGRAFADPAFTDRAIDRGLERAILSLHSHLSEIHCAISGIVPREHEACIQGIENLLDSGLTVMVNLVITKLNLGTLGAWLGWCFERFGRDLRLKIAFPTTVGHGGGWEGIALRYRDVAEELRGVLQRSQALGMNVAFEAVPNCVLGSPELEDLGRSGFGESHYLEDLHGRELLSIRHIEAALAVWPERCRNCLALPRCPGIAETYARRYGVEELSPFLNGDA